MKRNFLDEPVSASGRILGCSSCPLDKAPGAVKQKCLQGIKGRRAMLWCQEPGLAAKEPGAAGRLLWKALAEVGLTRADFDAQHVVRCSGSDHPPTRQELLSCSVYNDEALELNRGRAQVHLVLGDVAGQQLLGNAFRKDTPVFWHAPWDAYVVVAALPSSFLRDGRDDGNEGWTRTAWQARLRAVRAVLDHPGRHGRLKAQDCRTVRTTAEFDAMERELRAVTAEGRRVSFDVENDVVDGAEVMLLAGFGVGRYAVPGDWRSWEGTGWSVVLDHPEAGHAPGQLDALRGRLKRLIGDDAVKKALHNGSHDEEVLRKLLGAKLRGYDYDTMYGTWLRHSHLRANGLESLTYLFFPEMLDYKTAVPEWKPGAYAAAPLADLVLRNCGDCEATSRLEAMFSPQVRQPLVKVYIEAAKTLDKMEKRGPALDWDQWKKAEAVVPPMLGKLDNMLRRVTGDQNFNCGSDKQVAWLVYDVLRMPEGETRGTGKLILEKLQAEHPDDKVLDLVMKWRTLAKIKGTYLDGYAKSARRNDGELRTIWWLTGAATGRLRSGKGDDGDAVGIVNLQNLHGNPLLQNMLVSDKRWRSALKD